MNSRLNEVQAALLRVKLSHLDDINSERALIANMYLSKIKNERIILPDNTQGHTWHQFVIRTTNRDKVKEYLQSKGIGSEIHYPNMIFEIRLPRSESPLPETQRIMARAVTAWHTFSVWVLDSS